MNVHFISIDSVCMEYKSNRDICDTPEDLVFMRV